MSIQNSFKGIFKNKNVLVTGHTGFQGSWLSLWLKMLGANVIGYSLEAPTSPSLFEIINLENKIQHFTGDVRDLSSLKQVIKNTKPDIVFHLAAQSLVHVSYEEPRTTFETNIMGSVNLLESLRETNFSNVCIIATSDKCYKNDELQRPFKENDPLGGKDPYSASKGATEIVTSSYRDSFFNPNISKNITAISTVRSGNVIGGGDWAKDRLVPDCIRSLSSNLEISLRNPSSVRPWQFVLEPISGMLWLATKMLNDKKQFSDAWNFGPFIDKNITTTSLVQEIIKSWGSGKFTSHSENNIPEAKTLFLDTTKSENQLGWKSVYSFNETVSKTIDWYKNYFNNVDMKRFTEQQIQDYSQRAKDLKLIWQHSD
jgi:CDP-glucose 4,6-dehydratase